MHGKVISTAAENLPVLQRNKLLRNLNPDGVDATFDGPRKVLSAQRPSMVGGVSVDNLLELELSSRIEGASIRVIPIAIYA